MIWSINEQLDNGRYTINGDPLRANDFITTYLAQDRNGDRVIIKTLDGEYFQSLLPAERSGIEARFAQGGLSLSQCRNRHVVHTPRRPFQQDGLWCIALQYVDGNDLYSYTQQTRLPQDQVLRYIKQIGQGLIEVHRSNLWHLNVNPNNIILRRDINDEVILIGFSFIRGNLTTISQIVARNQNYSPIELLGTSTPDSRSDVYSLAATLYFLLTGLIPPLATDRILSTPDILTPQNSEFFRINPHIIEAICRGMSIKQEDRPQSIQEWLNLLEQTSFTPVAPPVTPSPRRRLTLNEKLAIGTLAAVLLGGIGALLQGLGAFRDKPSETKTNSSPTPSLTSTPSRATSSPIPSTIKSPNK